MRKDTYDFESKQLYRIELRKFIEKHYPNEINRKNLRVACLPGHEGLEVSEVYLPLGIKPTRITGIEQDEVAAQELKEKKLGINIYFGSALSFFQKNQVQLDIINLDFQSQFGKNEIDTLCALTHNERLRTKGILGTNFYGSRENGERKEEYNGTVDFFAEGGNTVRIGKSMKDTSSRKVVEALENNNEILRSESLEDLRDKTISMRLRYILSANSVVEAARDLSKDPFLFYYHKSIKDKEFPSLEDIMKNPTKYVNPINFLESMKDFYIMRVFHEAFPSDEKKQATLHAFWEVLQLHRPYFITDYTKGRYVSDTGSPMLFDFLYVENLKELTANIEGVFDRAEEADAMRFTFIEPVSAKKTNQLRPLTDREGILFALSGGDPYKIYRKGGLFIYGSQKIFWEAMDDIGEALLNEIRGVLSPRKDLVVPDKILIPLVPEIPKLSERMNYLPRNKFTALPRTHQKALEYFVEFANSGLSKIKQGKLERAFLSSNFDNYMCQPIEDIRFYAFLDDLRSDIIKDKPITQESIDSHYNLVKDTQSLVEVIPFKPKKFKEIKITGVSDLAKEEIRKLRTDGHEVEDIYNHLQGKGIKITRRQCGATAAWLSPKLSAKKRKLENFSLEVGG